MRRITAVQAAGLRELRKELGQLGQRIDSIESKTLALCGHDDIEAECPVCQLQAKIYRCRSRFAEYCRLLDDTLKSGPIPGGTT